MKIVETKRVEREIHVAPCLKCGSADIRLSDSGYSSFNIGGGKCNSCDHEATATCGCNVEIDELASIWNDKNDIPYLISKQKEIIANAQKQVEILTQKIK